MKEYYIWFLNKFNFPNAAVWDLIVFYEQIQADEECYNELMGIVDRYRRDINADVLKMINDVKSLSWTNAVHPFTRALIMLILMSKYLKGRYEEKGLPLDVWENSMKDLLYKCIECRLVYGIWGVFAAPGDGIGKGSDFRIFGGDGKKPYGSAAALGRAGGPGAARGRAGLSLCAFYHSFQ